MEDTYYLMVTAISMIISNSTTFTGFEPTVKDYEYEVGLLSHHYNSHPDKNHRNDNLR